MYLTVCIIRQDRVTSLLFFFCFWHVHVAAASQRGYVA